MTINSPEIQLKIAEWQSELRNMTGDQELILHAYGPLKFNVPENKKEPEWIIETICDETGIPFRVVAGNGRKREVVITRQLIAFFGRASGLTCTRLGELLDRDHTTVIHSCHTIQDLLDSNNPEICRLVARIHKRFEMVQA
jgi:chromosomal replication initiation ATPase DnaA